MVWGVAKLNTKGTLEIGEVPNIAFVITAMLNAFINTDMVNKTYLLNVSFLLINKGKLKGRLKNVQS